MSEPAIMITAADKAEGFASGSPMITPTARTGIKEPREHSDKAEGLALKSRESIATKPKAMPSFWSR